MATDDEVRRLILEVIGEEKVKSLREQIEIERQSLVNLTGTLTHLTAEQIANDKSVQAATIHLAEMNRELNRLRAGGGMNAGRAVLELSRGIEDLQYGIGGVVNNIPSLVMALGGGAGLAGVISLVSVGINQLVKHAFPDWEGGLKKVKDESSKLTEEMKEQIKALDALDKARPKKEVEAEADRAKIVSDVVGRYKEEIRKALGESMRSDLEKDIADMKARAETIAAAPPTAFSVEDLFNLRRNIARAAGRLPGVQREADITIGRAAAGSLAEFRRIQGLFGPNTEVGLGLQAADPEHIARVQQQRDANDLLQQQNQQAARLAHANEEAAKKRKQEELDASDTEMRAINEKIAIEEREKKQAAHKAEAEQRKADQEAKHRKMKADNQAKARASHEASLLEGAYGESDRLTAEQALSQGADPRAIQQAMANAYAKHKGISRQGADKAAASLMEKIMLDIAKNGGMGSELVKNQGKMLLHLQREQKRQQREMESARKDQKRFWDSAFSRGG